MPPVWILLFVLVDVLITAAVIAVILQRRGTLLATLAVEPERLREMKRATEADIESTLRANWDGGPGTLAPVLMTLLDRSEARWREAKLPVGRAALKAMLAHAVRDRGLAGAQDLREALRDVA